MEQFIYKRELPIILKRNTYDTIVKDVRMGQQLHFPHIGNVTEAIITFNTINGDFTKSYLVTKDNPDLNRLIWAMTRQEPKVVNNLYDLIGKHCAIDIVQRTSPDGTYEIIFEDIRGYFDDPPEETDSFPQQGR